MHSKISNTLLYGLFILTELTVITQEAELTQAGLNTEALLSLFIASLDIKKSSKESYRRALRPFFVYTEKKKLRLSELRREDIIEYKSSLFEAGALCFDCGSIHKRCKTVL